MKRCIEEVKNMDELKLNSLKADIDHDRVMIEQYGKQIKKLERKIEYYKGRVDASNDIIGQITNLKDKEPYEIKLKYPVGEFIEYSINDICDIFKRHVGEVINEKLFDAIQYEIKS